MVFTIQFTIRPKVTEPTGIKNYKARHTSEKCDVAYFHYSTQRKEH